MLLMLALVLAAALAMSWLLRCAVPVAAPTAVFCVILILFAFGALDQMFLGLVATLLLIVAGAGAAIVLEWRKHGTVAVLRLVLTPAVVVYLLILAVFAVSSRGLRFSNWDEFSHWGRVVAAMVSDDALPPLASADLIFAAYPPALPVWEYFLTRVSPEFMESHVFVAHHAYCLVLLLPFAARMSWRRPRHLMYLAVTSTLLMTSFFALDTILIDPALGMTFGYCLALALLGSPDGRTLWRHLGPALAVLTLLKDTGVLFALIVVVVLLARVGVRQRLTLGARRTRRVPAALVHGGLGLICVLVPTLIWRVLLSVSDTHSNWEGASVSEALNDLVQQGESWRRETTATFVTALTDQPLTTSPVPLAFWGWFGLALILLVATDVVRSFIVADRPLGRGVRYPATSALLAGALIYVAAIWLTYMTAFTQYEASNLASFARYLNVYWLAVVFVCLAVALRALESRAVEPPTVGNRSVDLEAYLVRAHAVVVLAVLVSLGQVHNIVQVIGRQHVANANSVRSPYDATAAVAATAGIGAGDDVWILDEHTTGFGYYVLSYELVDAHAAGWSVGPLKDEADVWTRDLTVAQWSAELEAFDYLLIHHTEPAFVDRYGKLFADPSAVTDQTVFSVEPGASGRVQLVAVEQP